MDVGSGRLGASLMKLHEHLETQQQSRKSVDVASSQKTHSFAQAMQVEQVLMQKSLRAQETSRTTSIKAKVPKKKSSGSTDPDDNDELIDPSMLEHSLGHGGEYNVEGLMRAQTNVMMMQFGFKDREKDDEEE